MNKDVYLSIIILITVVALEGSSYVLLLDTLLNSLKKTLILHNGQYQLPTTAVEFVACGVFEVGEEDSASSVRLARKSYL